MLNPVLRKESKVALRNWKIFLIIAVYALIIAAVSAVFIWANVRESYAYGFDPQNMVSMYAFLAGFQLALVLLITPVLTAGSISGERERQTLDLLLVTKMSPISIILGKLMSSLGMIILMIIAAMPVFAIIFYFGGISLTCLLAMTLFVIAVSLMEGAMAVFFSTIFKKTIMSMVLVYLLAGFMTFGTVILIVFYTSYADVVFGHDANIFINIAIGFLSPFTGFASLVDNQLGTDVLKRTIGSYYNTNVLNNIPDWIFENYWLICVGVFIVLAIVFITLAAVFLNKKSK